jgi:hypothetical protein
LTKSTDGYAVYLIIFTEGCQVFDYRKTEPSTYVTEEHDKINIYFLFLDLRLEFPFTSGMIFLALSVFADVYASL